MNELSEISRNTSWFLPSFHSINQWKGVWFDLIDGAVRRHNGRKNRDIGYTPNDIWLNNNNDILYMEKSEPSNMTAKDTTPQFDVGDYVRVTRRPRILEKAIIDEQMVSGLG